MSIIRLRAGQACQRCGASADLPHQTRRECLAAIGKEVESLLERTRVSRVRHARALERRAAALKARAASLSTRVARMGSDTASRSSRKRRRSA